MAAIVGIFLFLGMLASAVAFAVVTHKERSEDIDDDSDD